MVPVRFSVKLVSIYFFKKLFLFYYIIILVNSHYFTGDDGELVGEVDGASFGVGVAPAGTRPVPSSIVNGKRKDKKGSKARVEQKSAGYVFIMVITPVFHLGFRNSMSLPTYHWVN